MNLLEATSPGTKAQCILGYLDPAAPLFTAEDRAGLRPCGSCGQPTTGRFCAFCRARAQILGARLGEPREGGDVKGRDVKGARLGPPVTDREVAAQGSDEVLPAEIDRRASA